jgi:hypothetical protein
MDWSQISSSKDPEDKQIGWNAPHLQVFLGGEKNVEIDCNWLIGGFNDAMLGSDTGRCYPPEQD